MSDDKFYSHFQEVYGARWANLLAALMAPELQVARGNMFAPPTATALPASSIVPGCYQWEGGEISRDSNGLLQFYVMDPASILAAKALAVEDGDDVLDMCAAPGGKTLILAEGLPTAGELTANEMATDRRDRLKKVIQQYIPRSVRDRVWVTGKEGGLFAKSHPEKFDKILVDAPCSGERHLLQSPKDLQAWSLSRTQRLAQRQYALLTAALEAVRIGGRIVYSTCSISPLENDQVIARLLDKKGARVEVVEVSDPSGDRGEKTQFGWQFFPDHCGFGPIYFSVLRRTDNKTR